MISADSKNGAAFAAKYIISTAPIEKFGTISARADGDSPRQSRTVASLASSNPEVPTTTLRSWSRHHRRLSMTAPG